MTPEEEKAYEMMSTNGLSEEEIIEALEKARENTQQ